MDIYISRTYEIVTPESAEDGDIAESGFLVEREAVESFRELVELMREHPYCSSGGLGHVVTARDWFTGYTETDWRTGEAETHSLHLHRDSSPRAEHYWRKAAEYVERERARERERVTRYRAQREAVASGNGWMWEGMEPFG